MLINEQALIRLPVITQSGQKLGHIIDIEFDLASHSVRKYLVGAVFRKEVYLIAPSQIVEITDEKILVEDSIRKATNLTGSKKSILPREFDAAVPRTTEL